MEGNAAHLRSASSSRLPPSCSWRSRSFLNNFLTTDNILSLIQNVSILGILGIGMALTIIGRGIDLSIVATMAMSVAWCLDLIGQGVDVPLALLIGLAMVVVIGCLNGVLIAYVEIPAIFATLAMGTVVYGFGQFFLVPTDITYLAESAGWLKQIGGGNAFGVPSPVIVFAIVCLVTYLLLRYTKPGRYLYGMGDNPMAARVAGIPTRPMTVFQYIYASVVGYVAGIVTATAVDSMSTRVVNSTLVYDVILVAVIGGVGLERRQGRRAQRHRRHAADRHPAQRHDDHGHALHRPEHHQGRDPARRDHRRLDHQPPRRADRAARGHLNDQKEHRPITGSQWEETKHAIPADSWHPHWPHWRSATAPHW